MTIADHTKSFNTQVIRR